MDRLDLKHPNWQRFRSLWLAIAAVGLLTTPSAVINAVNLYHSEYRLGFLIPVAFSIRLAQI